MENWIIKIIDKGYKVSRDIYIFRRFPGGTEVLHNDGTATVFSPGKPIPEMPFMELEPEQLQALADELANVGYKPQKGFIEGELEGTKKHLEDMRRIVFKSKGLIN